jgi:hypothetical protein
MTAQSDVIDPKSNEIATTQLAVDGEVEQRQIALAVLELQPDANGPDLLRLKRALLADETAFVPRNAQRGALRLGFGGHDLTSTWPPPPSANVLRPISLSQQH